MACIKRRLLDAASISYFSGSGHTAGTAEPPWVAGRREEIGFVGEPKVVERGVDLALVGRIPEGVLIAFRGTQPPVALGDPHILSVTLDWLHDGELAQFDLGGGKWVHSGFWAALDNLWQGSDGVGVAIERTIAAGAPTKLFITGHSKGGPIANLAAWRLVHDLGKPAGDIRVVTFAAARPGNQAFADAFHALGIASTGYEVLADQVPRLPPGTSVSPMAKWLAHEIGLDSVALPLGYVSLDTRAVAPGSIIEALREQWTAWEVAIAAGLNFQPPLPLLAAAHSIYPGSAYDRFVCLGESPACGHN